MGVWIFTDIHIGVRSNSLEWMGIMNETFNSFIIPTITNNYKKGDIIICCGDVFDNRTSIHLKAIEIAQQLFERLSFMPIHIIAGNHDIYNKNTTEITSLDILKNIKNVNIYRECSYLKINDSKLFLMPWRKDINEESETLINNKADYAFMHGTFSGINFNKYGIVDEHQGANHKSARNYKRVYTGHIHWKQSIGNITVCGTPYQLTRGDLGNERGIYYLDLETNTETFYENKISPRFINISIDDKTDINELIKISKNNFVDINVSSDLLTTSSSYFTNLFRELANHCKSLNAIWNETTKTTTDVFDVYDPIVIINENIEKTFTGDNVYKAKEIINTYMK